MMWHKLNVNSKINWGETSAIIAGLFFLFSLYIFSMLYLGNRVETALFFNSDALFLPSLFKGTLREGNSFYDWMLPPSPYLFPDILVYAVAYAISSQVLIQILAFAIFQLLLFFILAARLLACFEPMPNAIVHSATLSSSIVFLGLYSADPFGLSFVGVFHFGSLLSLLLLAILYFEFLESGSSRKSRVVAIWTFLIGGAAAVSDRLILVHFILPILLMGLFLAPKDVRRNNTLRFGMILLLGALLLSLFAKFALPELGRLDTSFSLAVAGDKLMMLGLWYIEKPLWLQPVLWLFPLGMGVSLAYCYMNRGSRDAVTEKKKTFAFLFLILAVLSVLVVSLSDRAFTSRYMLPCLFLPGLILFVLGGRRWAGWLALVYLGPAIFIFASLQGKSSEYPDALGIPEFVRCVEGYAKEHGASAGFANYWDAIPLYVLNNSNLKLASVTSDLTPMPWMFNKHAGEGRFSFAVIDDNAEGMYRLSRPEIERRLGKKPIEYQCGRKTLLIFDGQKLALPQDSSIQEIRQGVGESFINNPRALLIMAEEASRQGHHQKAKRLVVEAIALLRRGGADEAIVRSYENAKDRIDENANKQE